MTMILGLSQANLDMRIVGGDLSLKMLVVLAMKIGQSCVAQAVS